MRLDNACEEAALSDFCGAGTSDVPANQWLGVRRPMADICHHLEKGGRELGYNSLGDVIKETKPEQRVQILRALHNIGINFNAEYHDPSNSGMITDRIQKDGAKETAIENHGRPHKERRSVAGMGGKREGEEEE